MGWRHFNEDKVLSKIDARSKPKLPRVKACSLPNQELPLGTNPMVGMSIKERGLYEFTLYLDNVNRTLELSWCKEKEEFLVDTIWQLQYHEDFDQITFLLTKLGYRKEVIPDFLESIEKYETYQEYLDNVVHLLNNLHDRSP